MIEYKTWPVVVCFIILCLTSAPIKFNFSSSLPVGIYYLSQSNDAEYGDYVSVCLHKAIAERGLQMGLLLPGFCSGHAMAVLKEVIAMPGDVINYDGIYLTVNGKKYYAPYKTKGDIGINTSHREITSGYLLYGSNNPERSWDSRYFGAIYSQSIQGIYRPLITQKANKVTNRLANCLGQGCRQAIRHPWQTLASDIVTEKSLTINRLTYRHATCTRPILVYQNFLTTHPQHQCYASVVSNRPGAGGVTVS